jgi:hypothetical protein
MALENPYYKTDNQKTVERLTPMLEAALKANDTKRYFTVAQMRALLPVDEQGAFTRAVCFQCLMALGFPQEFEGE